MVGTAGAVSVAGCLGGEDAEAEAADGDAEPEDDAGGEIEAEDDEERESVGTAEITFLGESYSFEDVSCEGHTTFPPENEMIRHRDADENVEFWVERDDPDESDVVEVRIGFPTGDADETIGEIESYVGRTTADEIEFELGSGTSGTLHLDPFDHMNDDVDHDPDGGEMEWTVSC